MGSRVEKWIPEGIEFFGQRENIKKREKFDGKKFREEEVEMSKDKWN